MPEILYNKYMSKKIETNAYISKASGSLKKNLHDDAWALLRRALKEHGFDTDIIEFEFNEFGKPYIKDSDVYFNLSHSGDYVMCVISGSEVGCDIQKIGPCKDNLAKRFFCNEEYQNIISQKTEDEQIDLFYRYWTLKESFIKATGMGLKLHLNSFQIILGNKISIKQSVNNKEYSFIEYNELDGYKCSVCVQGTNTAMDIKIIFLL